MALAMNKTTHGRNRVLYLPFYPPFAVAGNECLYYAYRAVTAVPRVIFLVIEISKLLFKFTFEDTAKLWLPQFNSAALLKAAFVGGGSSSLSEFPPF